MCALGCSGNKTSNAPFVCTGYKSEDQWTEKPIRRRDCLHRCTILYFYVLSLQKEDYIHYFKVKVSPMHGHANGMVS